MLFNVYVPTSGDVLFKLRFLRALRRAMAAQRDAGRVVVLAGDLNLSRRPEDVPWKERLLHLPTVLGEAAEEGGAAARGGGGAAHAAALPPALAARLRAAGPDVRRVLSELRVVLVPGKMDGNTAMHARKEASWRAFWTHPETGKDVVLGRGYDAEESAQKRWLKLGEIAMEDPGDDTQAAACGGARRGGGGASSSDEDDDDDDGFGGAAAKRARVCRAGDDGAAPLPRTVLLWRADHIQACQLVEVLTKALGMSLSEEEQAAVGGAGDCPAAPAWRAWADALEAEDGMVDSFVAMHPTARGRFTCWEQYTNGRCARRLSRFLPSHHPHRPSPRFLRTSESHPPSNNAGTRTTARASTSSSSTAPSSLRAVRACPTRPCPSAACTVSTRCLSRARRRPPPRAAATGPPPSRAAASWTPSCRCVPPAQNRAEQIRTMQNHARRGRAAAARISRPFLVLPPLLFAHAVCALPLPAPGV